MIFSKMSFMGGGSAFLNAACMTLWTVYSSMLLKSPSLVRRTLLVMLIQPRAVRASFAPIIACAANLHLSAYFCASEQWINSGVAVVPVVFVSLSAASLAFLSTASGVTALLDLGPYVF